MQLNTFENEKSWLTALADQFQEIAGLTIHERGSIYVALSGGKTPMPFYQHLAQRNDAPWSAAHFFLGDERLVPMEDKRSNYRNIYQAFFPRKINLYRWKTEMPRVEDIPLEYEHQICAQAGSPPKFDLIFLGIGEDGHIASLFPNTSALKEETRFTALNRVPQMEEFRLTFTLKTIQQARKIIFLTRAPKPLEHIQKILADPSTPAGSLQHENVELFHCLS